MAVLMGRLIMKEDNHVHSFLIKNLSLADLLMGVYLFVLATHDLRYRGRYLARDKEWRDSWGCDVCGILTTVSSEASVLILTIITLDRYMCILYPLKMRKRSLTFAYITMLVIWCACVALAVLPVMRLSYFGNYFYRNNAVCIPLFLHEPRGDGWEYSAFIFLGINMASFIFIAYAYAAMFLAIRRSRLMIRPADEHQERCLMKRFFFIVVTDLICWAPIMSLKAAALAGVGISGNLYAWVVIFILPVNCALNPLLYTLTTRLFKQRLSAGLAQAMLRRRSLETHSSSSVSFTSLKSKSSSHRSGKDVNELKVCNRNKKRLTLRFCCCYCYCYNNYYYISYYSYNYYRHYYISYYSYNYYRHYYSYYYHHCYFYYNSNYYNNYYCNYHYYSYYYCYNDYNNYNNNNCYCYYYYYYCYYYYYYYYCY
nr:hypothetical protein BaRGS_009365 [Batillaria attramentaria]